MEGVSVGMYKGIKGYWRRKDYERLDGTTTTTDRPPRRKNHHHHHRVELDSSSSSNGSSNKRRRFNWRIKITPKLRFSSTKRIVKRIRDAYVKMMVSFARSRVFINGFGGSGSSIGYGLGKPHLQYYDEKALIEIYKSMIAQGQLVPRDAGIISS